MKHATFVTVFYVAAILLIAWLLTSPILAVVGLALYPSIMHALPFGLIQGEQEQEHHRHGAVMVDEEPDHHVGPIGFTADVKG